MLTPTKSTHSSFYFTLFVYELNAKPSSCFHTKLSFCVHHRTKSDTVSVITFSRWWSVCPSLEKQRILLTHKLSNLLLWTESAANVF